MAVLVDTPRWPWRGELWAHLVSDLSFDELHRFANHLGLRRLAFQGDHYDLPSGLLDRAVSAGASLVDSRVLVRSLREAGLRHRRSLDWTRELWLPDAAPARIAAAVEAHADIRRLGLLPSMLAHVRTESPSSLAVLRRVGQLGVGLTVPSSENRAGTDRVPHADAGLGSDGSWRALLPSGELAIDWVVASKSSDA